MTEEEMQACLKAGNLAGTPSECCALEVAFAFGRTGVLLEVIEELETMDCSMSARDAAVDLKQSYVLDLT